MVGMIFNIIGNTAVKTAIILGVLEAAKYFHSPKLLAWWLLVLFVGSSYSRSENGKQENNI